MLAEITKTNRCGKYDFKDRTLATHINNNDDNYMYTVVIIGESQHGTGVTFDVRQDTLEM